MKRTDKTMPLPAPAGTQWHIRETVFARAGDGSAVYTLGLWPEGVVPDKRGMAYGPPLKKARQNFAKGATLPIRALASELFYNERQIRRASIRALSTFAAQKKMDERTAALVSRPLNEEAP